MFLSQSVNDAMQPHFPEDPLPGQVVKIPDGIDGGSVTHITIYNKNRVIGEAQQLIKVENVSSKWQLGRTNTIIPLHPEDIVQVRAVTKQYASLIFVEFFGWTGFMLQDVETVLSNKVYTIQHVASYSATKGGPYVYELVCLHSEKKENKE